MFFLTVMDGERPQVPEDLLMALAEQRSSHGQNLLAVEQQDDNILAPIHPQLVSEI